MAPPPLFCGRNDTLESVDKGATKFENCEFMIVTFLPLVTVITGAVHFWLILKPEIPMGALKYSNLASLA